MTLTLVGTAIGGSILLGYMTSGYELGMGQIWLGLVAVVPSVIIVTVLATPIRRLGARYGMVTLGDFSALVYGKQRGCPRPSSMLFAYCAITGMQFVAIATVLTLTTGLDMTWASRSAGSCSRSNRPRRAQIRGVPGRPARDDPDSGHLRPLRRRHHRFGRLGDHRDQCRQDGSLSDLGFANIPPSQLAVLFLTIGGYQFVRQDLWQRIWASRTMAVLRTSFWIAIVLQTLLGTVVVVLGVMAKFGLGIVSADPAHIYYEIIGEVFPFSLVVVMLIALLATVISTADSFFLAGSSSIVNDIIRPRLSAPTSTSLLRWSKISVLITSVIAYVMALYIPELIVLWIVGTAMLVSGLLAPVIIGLFWKDVSRTAGVWAMWAGLVAAVGWQLLGQPLGWHPVFVGLPLSIVVLVGGSLLLRDRTRETESWYRHSKTITDEIAEEAIAYE